MSAPLPPIPPHTFFKVSPIFPSEVAELAYLEGLKNYAGLTEDVGKLMDASRRLVFASVSLPFSSGQLDALARLLRFPPVTGSVFFEKMDVPHIIEGFNVLTIDPQTPSTSLDPSVNTFDKAVYVAIRNLVNSDMCPRGAGMIDPKAITGSLMSLILDLWKEATSSEASDVPKVADALGEEEKEESEEEASEEEASEKEKEASEEEEEASEEEKEASEEEESSEEPTLNPDDVKGWVITTFKPTARTSKRLDELISKVLADDLDDEKKLIKVAVAVLKLDKRQLTSVNYRKAVSAFLTG
jgi:hypothetical protein